MKRLLLLLAMFILITSPIIAQSTIYIAPTGADSNPGTLAAPTTLAKAITLVSVGGTIYARGGTYNLSSTIIIARGNDGSAGALKKIFAYNSEVPVFNFSGQAVSTSSRGIVVDALYWHLKGLIIERAGDNGVLLSGNNNIIESCIFRGNNDSGLQMSRYNTSYNSITQWPSGNLILNCEAYDNKDPDNEDADGFAAKLTCGNNNIFRNCVAHHNIDDGWDLYTKSDTGPIGAILLENCIAHSNGTLTTGGTSGNGDKNGFKLGGEDIGVNHIVRRCIAFNNGKHGFTYNRNLGTIEMTNNTAFGNTERNFNFDGGTSTFKNNLSYYTSSHTNDKFIGTVVGTTNAFWLNNAAINFAVSSADFTSLTPGSNANPTASGFLNLASGSDLINAGATSSGIVYTGSAPDIGAVESGGTAPSTYTLTVNSSPSAGGSIAKSPNNSSYNAGTVVTLTAQPATGYVFSGWSGAASGTSTTTTVVMNSNLTATATFTASNNPGTITLGATAGDAQVALSWTVVNITLTGQEVYRDTDSDPAGRVRIATPTTSARNYTDATAVNGTTYYYWIKGGDATTTYNSNAAQATPQGSGTGTTLHLEESATPTSGYCGADGSRQNSYAGASNGYYINISNSINKGITWKVNAAGGTYTLVWRYANAGSSSATSAKVLVNGAIAVAGVPFPKTSSWTTWLTASTSVTLAAGVNTIRLETTSGNEFANIDWIEITGAGLSAASCGSGRESVQVEFADGLLQAYPNPTDGNITLQFDVDKPGDVLITTMSQLGQATSSFLKNFDHPGLKTISIDLHHRGMNFISVDDGMRRRFVKVIVE